MLPHEPAGPAESEADFDFSPPDYHDRVPLRTLVLVRWIAIVGQISALAAAAVLFDIALDIYGCLAVVALSVVANGLALAVYARNKRLTEGETAGWLVFDVLQLWALLALTGGLNNPFAMLIIAPVAIAAGTLGSRSVLLVGGIAAILTLALRFLHLPLISHAGVQLGLPSQFVLGFGIAILIGIGFVGIYAHRIASDVGAMSRALLAAQVALAREQKLSGLAGVVAATAHELGTPLATIKLASSELISELEEDSDLIRDARLIREQAERCSQILRSMGRAGKDDRLIRVVPLEAVIREAMAPHADRGKAIILSLAPQIGRSAQPSIERKPEIIHALRNIIQNAVDFATRTVRITADWDAERVTIQITDDGPGIPPHLLGRIGDPFLRDRRGTEAAPSRKDYQGMGLGLFIAVNLLRRTGAEIDFANRDGRGREEGAGARITIGWPRDRIAADAAALDTENPRNPE